MQGASRLAKGIVTSAITQKQNKNLLIVCATLEEAARWMAQIELMGWKGRYFYPTSEASPYESFNRESEMIWGQLQTLSSLVNRDDDSQNLVIVTTEKALQPHLPPPSVLAELLS